MVTLISEIPRFAISLKLLVFQLMEYTPVAEPGFPRGGGANSQGAPTYDFAKFSQKLHEIERIWAGGAHVPRAPLRSATALPSVSSIYM